MYLSKVELDKIGVVTLTIFFQEAKCRHEVFSVYFGDEKPKCKMCDVCKDRKGTEKLVENFHFSQYRNAAFRYARYRCKCLTSFLKF